MSTDGVIAVPGFRDAPPEFLAALRDGCARDNLDPDFIATVISFETGGRLEPAVRNPYSGAVGIIQWTEGSARAQGTSQAKIARMTLTEQLELVFARYRRFSRLRNLCDYYLVVFAPAYAGRQDDSIPIYRGDKGTPAERLRYTQNAALDRDKDLIITRGEACARCYAIYVSAISRPRIPWPEGPFPAERSAPEHSEGGGIGPIFGLLAGAALLVAIMAGRRRP